MRNRFTMAVLAVLVVVGLAADPVDGRRTQAVSVDRHRDGGRPQGEDDGRRQGGETWEFSRMA